MKALYARHLASLKAIYIPSIASSWVYMSSRGFYLHDEMNIHTFRIDICTVATISVSCGYILQNRHLPSHWKTLCLRVIFRHVAEVPCYCQGSMFSDLIDNHASGSNIGFRQCWTNVELISANIWLPLFQSITRILANLSELSDARFNLCHERRITGKTLYTWLIDGV